MIDHLVYSLVIGSLIISGNLLGLTIFIETQQIVWSPLLIFAILALVYIFALLIDCLLSNPNDS